ncbi:MAG: hypothetical protein AAGL66_05115, partial [Pseudomonadota bacterium]
YGRAAVVAGGGEKLTPNQPWIGDVVEEDPLSVLIKSQNDELVGARFKLRKIFPTRDWTSGLAARVDYRVTEQWSR